MAIVDEPVVSLMTTERFLALPEHEDIERELIRGELREKPMTTRSRKHTSAAGRLAYFLWSWLDDRTPPKGEVHVGEVRCRLRRDPDTTVGIDVAYFSAETIAETPERAHYIDGPPVLAVEILSPSDKHEEITEKIEEYLDAGVRWVWIVDPNFRIVRVHQPAKEPVLFNVEQDLIAEPDMPGLLIPVAKIFEG